MPDSSVLGLLARLVVSLAVVIGLMILLASFLRKRGVVVGSGGRKQRGGVSWNIDVLARRGLGRNVQVAVVRAGGRTLLLGITEQQVSMLAEADPAAVAVLDAADEIDPDGGTQWTGYPGTGTPGPGSPWKTLLDVVRDRTVRR